MSIYIYTFIFNWYYNGFAGTFYLFCGISALGMIVLYFLLPETKNKTLEEVEELFMSEEYKRKHKQPKKYAEKDNPAFDGEKL